MGQVVPATETCVTDTDEDCDKKECALWSWMTAGATSAAAINIDTDSKGNLIVFGAFSGVLQLGATSLDEANGGKLFIMKADASGNPLWAKNFGGPNPQFTFVGDSLAVDSADNIYVGFNFTGHLEFGNTMFDASGKDLAIAKFTPSGVRAWSQSYGGAMDQSLWELFVDDGGVLRAAGLYFGAISIGGTGGNGSGLFVARISASSGAASSALTLDSALYGEPRLAKGPNNTWALAARCPSTVTIGGQTLNSCENFVAKLDENDVASWLVGLPQRPNDVVIDSVGNVLVTADFQNSLMVGQTNLQSEGSWDTFVASLSAASGQVSWAKSWGGVGDDEFAQLAIDGQDRLYLTLNVQDAIDFGGGTLTAQGLGDTFVAAFDPVGTHRWSRVFGDATLQSGEIAARSDGGGVFVAVNLAGDVNFGAGPHHSEALQFAVAELAP